MSEHARKTLLRSGTVVVGIVGLVFGIGLAERGGTATYEGLGVDHWFQSLGSASERDRDSAAYSLGQLVQCSDESVRALAIALEDPEPRVRYISVYALKRFGTAARLAIPALRKRMEDAEESIRKGAAEVLTELEKMTVTNGN